MDAPYARAKLEGYRSRAAYKLLELARRYRLIAPGDRVVDLGAWPGGWLQVAVRLAGRRGRVVGLDLQEIEPVAGTSLIIGDARRPEVWEEIRRRSGGPVDVLLSDMAPKLTGVRARDEAMAGELASTALALAERLVKPGGRLLMKLFMSADAEELLRAARHHFRTVKLSRPDSSRKGSAEVYLVALDRLSISAFVCDN